MKPTNDNFDKRIFLKKNELDRSGGASMFWKIIYGTIIIFILAMIVIGLIWGKGYFL